MVPVRRPHASRGNAARRSCRRAALLLPLLACLTGCEMLLHLATLELDPDIRSADYSHFHDTVLYNGIRRDWDLRMRAGNCASGYFLNLLDALTGHYCNEPPDRVAADLRTQGAICVQTDEREFMCTYRQIVYCKTRSWMVGNADHRSDIELQIQVRDHPDVYKRFVVENWTKITRLDAHI